MGEARLLANRYRLDEVVGRGGMGTVWRAYDVMLDREVAVKEVVLPPGLTVSERDVLYERTFREARASARLSHPGVVVVHDVVEESDRPWIVMELVLARSLQDLLEEGPLGHRQVAEIGMQMLAALGHAHEKGILHRDVKPSNVLITDAGRVVLTDFGIAQVEGDSTLTQTGLVMGSPAYIPPERAQGERAVPASDLWALGATLYAALEGHSPYERSDAMSSLQAALTEPVPVPRNAGPLNRVLVGLLAREPVYRITGAQARPLLARVAAMPPPPPPAPPQPVPPPVAEDTVMDEFPGTDEAAETVMDAADLDPVTRRDPGPGGFAGGAGRPSGEPEVRTMVETEWSPPPPAPSQTQPPPALAKTQPPPQQRPSQTQPPPYSPPPRVPPQRVQPPPQPPQPPQTPQPWEQPQQFSQWQQPVRPDQGAARPGDRERRKTIVIVTVAVVLVVAAVLAGAFILRSRLGTGAMGAGPPAPACARGDAGGAAGTLSCW
ncbi:serine/threonine-protein kinase [Actinomadura xylanilytica]|uniref:serine/threonine-protein kinase n=1 Tax=Actinomadura xylanilytica TaxID=887459 RepID=UPI00255A7241|nr:serine/threonine-protein kinase [Actinomadura xylanilytica]MDL4775921.1 serine/threonine-protein kinase [Actinomadura xylanilytica]